MLYSRSLQVLLAFTALVPFVSASSPVVAAPGSEITSPPTPTLLPRQAAFTPLAQKGPIPFANLPYKVDTDIGLIRGDQWGYNICNATTETQQSLCQTSWLNSLTDFCLWGPPDYGRSVGDIEGIMVAYCSKPGHGTRLIPEGALTGLQFMKTPDYIQIVGYLNQTEINMLPEDYGGEMDPHGADRRGNPMGGVIYSTSFTGSPVQQIQWHNFIGAGKFCLKVCDNRGPNAAHFCEHIYDRIGSAYNCPNNAQDGVFESCEGDNQDYPGIYTGANGVVTTYRQPDEALGAITSIPYVARVPASRNCRQFTSSAIYTGLPPGARAIATAATTASTTSSTNTGTQGTSSKPTTGTTTGPGSAPTGAAVSLQVPALFGMVSLMSLVYVAL